MQYTIARHTLLEDWSPPNSQTTALRGRHCDWIYSSESKKDETFNRRAIDSVVKESDLIMSQTVEMLLWDLAVKRGIKPGE